MSLTPGPWARRSRMAKGRSATVPGSKTVSRCPMTRTEEPATSRSQVPMIVSPKSAFA